jgi:hypothetical protein
MRAALLIVACLVASPVSAEFLLVEYGWQQPEPITLPATYTFSMESQALMDIRPNGFVGWPLVFTEPGTVTTDADFLAVMNRVLTAEVNDNVRIGLGNDGQYYDAMPGDNFPFGIAWHNWPQPFSDRGLFAAAHVPNPRGNQYPWGLQGYWLTRVDRTVTDTGAQYIRFYGIVIPEPASAVTLITALSVCSLAARSARPARRACAAGRPAPGHRQAGA